MTKICTYGYLSKALKTTIVMNCSMMHKNLNKLNSSHKNKRTNRQRITDYKVCYKKCEKMICKLVQHKVHRPTFDRDTKIITLRHVFKNHYSFFWKITKKILQDFFDQNIKTG